MRRLDLAIPSERLIGFTIPRENSFLVCDHDEVWLVSVDSSTDIETTDYAPYEIAARPDFIGWGREDADPIMQTGKSKISYDFDPRADVLRLQYIVDDTEGEIDFPLLSGDWFAASFSQEGKLLVLAEPYHLHLYHIAS